MKSFLDKIKVKANTYNDLTTEKTNKQPIEVDIPAKAEELPTLNQVLNPQKDIVAVKNVFEKLKSTSGRIAKENILKDNLDQYLFMDILKFLCNDMITTGISSKKMSVEEEFTEKTMTSDMSVALNYITNHNTGRKEDVAWVQAFTRGHEEECHDFLKAVFTKSYKCGITASTLNKILPNSVPEFSVMLAESYEKNKKKLKKGTRFILTEKLDGMRIIAIKQSSKVSFFSRQGKPIEELTDIEKDFLNDALPEGVYDGELIAIGYFSESKDLYKETMKRARIKGPKTGLKMVCFDYIENVDDFLLRGECSTKFEDRKDELYDILHKLEYDAGEGCEVPVEVCDYIRYLDNLYAGDDLEELSKWYEATITLGGEGIMINIADAPYECKRVKSLLKYKEFKTADLTVLGVEEGDGNIKGTLGALVVDYKGFKVKVGSGFDMETRAAIWQNQEDIIGKIVEVQYFEETQNEQGGTSIRFPVFIDVREDKTEPSYA